MPMNKIEFVVRLHFHQVNLNGTNYVVADLDRCCSGKSLVYVCSTHWFCKFSEYFSWRSAVSSRQLIITLFYRSICIFICTGICIYLHFLWTPNMHLLKATIPFCFLSFFFWETKFFSTVLCHSVRFQYEENVTPCLSCLTSCKKFMCALSRRFKCFLLYLILETSGYFLLSPQLELAKFSLCLHDGCVQFLELWKKTTTLACIMLAIQYSCYQFFLSYARWQLF